MRAARALEALRPDVAHFTNGMIPLGSPVVDGRDHSRHEPAAVSAVSPGAPAADQSAADARGDSAGGGDRDRVAQRAARSAAAARHRRRIASPSCTKPPARRFGRSPIAPRSTHARALRPAAAVRPVCRHHRAAQEPAAADGGVCRRARAAAFRTSWCASARTDGRRAISPATSSASAFARRALHRLRAVRGSAGDLQPRRVLRVPVAVRRLRPAGRRSDGVRARRCITSNTSSLDEIAGGAAETIDPTTPTRWRRRCCGSRRDAGAGAAICRAARPGCAPRQFSWTRTAREMLAVYQRAAGVTVAPATVPAPPRRADGAGARAVSRGDVA